MAVTEILQQPLAPNTVAVEYRVLPVGQDIIFTVANDAAVYNQTQVKFIAEVHVSSHPNSAPYGLPPNTGSSAEVIGTFKTTPNNAGVGIFNFRSILENYVKADNTGSPFSSFKGTQYVWGQSSGIVHPLQLVDKFSFNDNCFRYFVIQFSVEYLGGDPNLPSTAVGVAPGTVVNSDPYAIMNAYVKYTDTLTTQTNSSGIAEFGLDLIDFRLMSSAKRFLTNAPDTQNALVNDYGTMSYLLTFPGFANNLDRITFIYYNSAGVQIGTEDMDRDLANGAYPNWGLFSNMQILHFGVFPGNLQNWSTTFQGLVAANTIQGGYYTVQAKGSSPTTCSQLYRINVNCPDEKQFESIRLCWLNQWGVWDYYTFTKKSIRTITSTPTTYEQSEGTWNARGYKPESYKGGKKNFRVNAVEKIKINSDYESEDINVIFEELTNSIEVYMLKGYSTDMTINKLDGAVTPVRITSTSFVKKTVANDKLIQYTFEIEKSKTFRTQSV
jgi:hypothetical protein